MRGQSRLVGVDAARGVALLGMMAVHVLPARDVDGATTFVLATGGAALVVLGLALLLAGTPARLLLAPLAAAGSMPLSLYTAHVLVLGTTDSDDPTRYYLLQVAAALVLAVLWRQRVGRGPLELLLGLLTGPVAGRART